METSHTSMFVLVISMDMLLIKESLSLNVVCQLSKRHNFFGTHETCKLVITGIFLPSYSNSLGINMEILHFKC